MDNNGTDINYNQTYVGQSRDEHTGLDYNYFRDFDSTTGRYLTPDLIGIAGGINRYAYANGNPVMLNDPHGAVVCGGVCIGVVVVGGVTPHYIRNTLNRPVTYEVADNTWQR